MHNLYAVCICLKPLPGCGGAWSAATSYLCLPYASSKKTNSFSGARPPLACQYTLRSTSWSDVAKNLPMS